MELQCCRVWKWSGADLARVRSLSCVDSHVNCQLGSLVELGPTLIAFERFVLCISGVGSHMVFDVALEGFVTHITLVHFLALVKWQNVSLESVSSGICFVTEMALKFLVVLMQLLVGLQVATAGECRITLVTLVRFVSTVDPLMHNQLSTSSKTLPALFAGIGLFSAVNSFVQP